MERGQKVLYGISAVLVLGVASEFCYYLVKKCMKSKSKVKKIRQVINNAKESVAVPNKDKKEDNSSLILNEDEMFVGHKDPDLWNTVLFFPDIMWDSPGSTTMQLFSYFQQAKISIHACIYQLSFHQVEKILIKKHKEGVRVYFISDYDPNNSFNRKSNPMLKAGIEMRHKQKEIMHKDLHHKFAIIDEEAVITGSLNWSRQGIESNKENVMITTNPKFVEQYLIEFKRLWELFEIAEIPKCDE